MGRQSSRIVNGLFDHKDIVKDGYYHTQVWHDGELVWEKLAESQFVFTIGYFTGSYSFWANGDITIDWGDGESESYSQSDAEYATYHEYNYNRDNHANGYIRIKISGELTYINFVNNQILTVETPFPKSMEAADFRYCFQNCPVLNSVPEGLFENCVSSTNFTSCFEECTSLTKIPKGLFRNCLKAQNFISCFRNCNKLIEIEEEIFAGCVSAEYFSDCFSNCYNLAEMAEGMFLECVSAKYFDSTFSNCTALHGSIPQGLFDDCTEVESFKQCFYRTKIVEIPKDLFDKCTKVKDFSLTFSYCSNITSSVPELWNRTNIEEYTDCYYGCTNAANYADIPDDWK